MKNGETQLKKGGRSAAAKQIRGSSLLVIGRGLSLLLNFGVQILTVRYLSKLDYGAFANALSMVSLGATICVLGLSKAVSRFAALHHERKEYGQLFGVIALSAGIISSIGLLLISAVHLFPERFGNASSSPLTVTLLLILIVMAPMDAMNSLLQSLFAVFSNAWAIFFRRYILGPGLKMAAVLTVTLTSGSAETLAVAYVVAGALGLMIGVSLLFKILKDEKLLSHFQLEEIELFPRRLLGFSVPMMGSEMVLVLRGTAIIVLLGYFHDAATVAAFGAVFPVARMIRSVLESFTLMFMPAVARLQARGQMDELGEMYWRSTAWVAMLSFPAFIVVFSSARPLTTLLFGERYADSAVILAVLSLGYFVQSCLGLASRTLKAMGMVSMIMKIDGTAIVIALTLNFLLIPKFGALGGAIAACVTLCLHMLLNQIGLVYASGIPAFYRPYLSMCGLFALSAAGLTFAQIRWSLPIVAAVPIAAVICLLLVYLCRNLLQVPDTFPELAKVPLIGKTVSRVLSSPTAVGGGAMTATSDLTKVAYLTSRFPKVTETFVLYEILALEKNGMVADVYSLQREKAQFWQPGAERVMERAHFAPFLSPGVILSNLRLMLRAPLRYFGTLFALIKGNLGSLRFLAGAIAFFPKTVHFARLMEADGVSHVHAHFASHPAASAFVIHRLVGIPYSFTAHGSDIHKDQHMLREKVDGAAFVVTISEYNRRFIEEACGEFPNGKIKVVHCGVDIERFSAGKESARGDQITGELNILCIGTLHEVKGQTHLISACKLLAERGVAFECHLLGGGPDRASLERQATAAGVGDRIHFHGAQNQQQVATFLQRADVLVAPSVLSSDGRREGIPVVLMEGMSSGVAVIASRLSGIPELVEHEVSGLLIEPGDSRGLADALQLLTKDELLRRRLALAGRERVENAFNLERNADQLVSLFRRSSEEQCA